jgi:hypothetical protein
MSNIHGVRIVTLALRHLLAIFSQDNTINDQVLKRFPAHNSSRNDHEGVEPSSGLIETFSNELSWEPLFEIFF